MTVLCVFLQDAKNGAEIKAVDAYCWLHSTVHLDSSLLRKLTTMPQIRAPCIGLTAPSAGLDPGGTTLETCKYYRNTCKLREMYYQYSHVVENIAQHK